MKYFLPFILIFFIVHCQSVFYYPDKVIYFHPKEHNIKYKDIRFHSKKDKTLLHGWFFPAKNKPAKGTIIQFHGNAQNISSHSLSLIWVTKHGFNLFSFDYRGYGMSQGEPQDPGMIYDGVSAIEWVQSQAVSLRGKRIYVHGQSLGGIKALSSILHLEKKQIDAVIIQSSFLSYQEIARDRMSSVWLLWPFQHLSYLLISDEYSPKNRLNEFSSMPFLVIHGDQDRIVPIEFGLEIFEKLEKNPKFLLRTPQAHHIHSLSSEFPKNRRKYIHFLNHLSQ